MVLIDSSAWVEYLRRTGSAAHRAVVAAVSDGSAVTTDPVVLEILVGTSSAHVAQVTRLLGTQQFVAQQPLLDVRAAADIYHACRRHGATPRSSVDCLIAAIALRADLPLLHRDRDFATIAAHTPLRVAAA